MTIYVLRLNDYPIGAYSTEELADKAATEHEAVFFKWRPEHAPRFYGVHTFELDGKAGL
jgi:hypothetical protein